LTPIVEWKPGFPSHNHFSRDQELRNDAWISIAEAHQENGEYDKAIKVYEEAIHVHIKALETPRNGLQSDYLGDDEPVYGYGRTLGDAQFLERDSLKNTVLWIALGEAYKARGVGSAITAFQKVLNETQNNLWLMSVITDSGATSGRSAEGEGVSEIAGDNGNDMNHDDSVSLHLSILTCTTRYDPMINEMRARSRSEISYKVFLFNRR